MKNTLYLVFSFWARETLAFMVPGAERDNRSVISSSFTHSSLVIHSFLRKYHFSIEIRCVFFSSSNEAQR